MNIDLHRINDPIFLADVFKNSRKICLNIYQVDCAEFLSAPGLAWQAALKKTYVKLGLLNDIDMLLIVEKGIRRSICHAIHRYAKTNKKCTLLPRLRVHPVLGRNALLNGTEHMRP